jgi:MinD-like ATPase involved in chromosome partitioning or flagellar assembly
MIAMDQAKTLRHLLRQPQVSIRPIFGDVTVDYSACMARFIQEQLDGLGHTSVIVDTSTRGLNQLVPPRSRVDMAEFLLRRAPLEDQVIEMQQGQWLLPARKGLDVMMREPSAARGWLDQWHRMPATLDEVLITLPYEGVAVASALGVHQDCCWLIQPTAESVTRAFHALRTASGVDTATRHRVIVAGVKHTDEADHVFANLLESTTGFLVEPLQYAGHLPALKPGQPLSEMSRDMLAAGRRVAKTLCALEEQMAAS